MARIYQDSHQKSRSKFKTPANSSYFLQSSVSELEVGNFSEVPGEEFRDLIQAIANNSDPEALPALVFNTSNVNRLPSEKPVDCQQALNLRT